MKDQCRKRYIQLMMLAGSIAILCILASCHKEKDNYNYQWFYVSSELEKMVYPNRTYWLYRCDSVQGLDSSWSYNFESGTSYIYTGLHQYGVYP